VLSKTEKYNAEGVIDSINQSKFTIM